MGSPEWQDSSMAEEASLQASPPALGPHLGACAQAEPHIYAPTLPKRGGPQTQIQPGTSLVVTLQQWVSGRHSTPQPCWVAWHSLHIQAVLYAWSRSICLDCSPHPPSICLPSHPLLHMVHSPLAPSGSFHHSPPGYRLLGCTSGVLWTCPTPCTSHEVKWKSISCVRVFESPPVACQSVLSMALSRQEHWSGLPFPSPGIFPSQG